MANETVKETDCNQIIEDYIKKQKDRIKKLKSKHNKTKNNE
jgi:hypothetical protein